MNRQDALAFIDEAIEALAVEGYIISDNAPDERIPAIQLTIAVNLERVDCAIGPRGESMFASIAENIKQAMVALHGARQALLPGQPA